MEYVMPMNTQTELVSKPALWSGRLISGFAILFLAFDGVIKLVPWPVVSDTIDRIGHGSSETLPRVLGAITIACAVLCPIPPTSILGAILLLGDLGGAIASQLRVGSPPFTHVMFGVYLGLMVWGAFWLRDGTPRMRLLLRG
jgi:hypothetical protein